MARESSPELECASDGSFEALQCRANDDVLACECVRPDTGAVIPGSQVIVLDRADAPDCDAMGEEYVKMFTLVK